MISGSEDFEIRAWLPLESSDSMFTLQGHDGVITSVELLEGGMLGSCSTDKSLKIWSLSKQKVMLEKKSEEEILSMAHDK